MFSSWPVSALVAGVKSGSGRREEFAQAGGQFDAADAAGSSGNPSSRSPTGSRARRIRWPTAAPFAPPCCAWPECWRETPTPAGRGSFGPAAKWLGAMWRTRLNQKYESWVSTSPLRGMPLGITQSNADIRSVATNNKRSPKSKISRTLPLFNFLIPVNSNLSNGSLSIRANISASLAMKSAKSQEIGPLRGEDKVASLGIGAQSRRAIAPPSQAVAPKPRDPGRFSRHSQHEKSGPSQQPP